MATPKVLILVLNYNGGSFLEECLRSLQGTSYPAARLVVVDNGSTDGSIEIPRHLDVETHAYGENLGYCAAYNRAFRELADDVDFVLLSNADVLVPPPTIERMMDAALPDEGIGFVGPVQRHADTGEVRSAGIRWSCGRLPRNVSRPGEPIDGLEGAFLLVRRSVIDRVGGLDEAFALGFEDIDWQLRAAHAGFRSILARNAEILHRRPGAARIATGAYYEARNACRMTASHCGHGTLLALEVRLYAEGIAALVLGRPRGRFILSGLRDFRRGVTGMKRFD